VSYKFPSFVTVSFSNQPPKNDEAWPQGEGEPASSSGDLNERRTCQRFVGRLHGEPCFWALIFNERLALSNLSLKGFALPAFPALVPGVQFDFVLQREGVPDTVRGHAEVVSVFDEGTPSAGCCIIGFESDSEERLRDWLVTHVILCSTVRISEKDAVAIVSGGSLV
jgi:hypothetical protein